MDDWGSEHLQAWLALRLELPIGSLFCVPQRPHPRPAVVGCGGACPFAPGGRHRRRAARLAPHQLRHAHAVEMAHEGVPLTVIQRQLAQRLGITSIYLQGIDNTEIVDTVQARRAPMDSGQRDASALMRFSAIARRA